MLPMRYAIMAAMFFASSSFAADYYVDQGIAADCSDYQSSSRSCGTGSEVAYKSLDSGLVVLAAGDTLYLRAGSFGQINPPRSGSEGQPISIRAMTGELVTITDSQVALWIIDRTDIVIADLVVDNVEGFGRIEGSSRIVIDSVDFSNASASGTTGSLKFVRSVLNTVSNSSFDEGSDLLLLQDESNANVLIGNTFGRAQHSLISIRCSSQNVIRNNDFDNPRQKGMEVFDCEGVSDAPVRLDATSRNLIEENRFSGTAASGQANNFNAIQHGGQNTIVRSNVFKNNKGGGVNYQYYGQESLHVNGNRLYNNTFYSNDCYAIVGQSGSGSQFFDNRVVNNLLYRNVSCSGGSSQTDIANSGQVILTNNTLASSDPGFVDAGNEVLTLLASSAEIDAGRFVARTAGSGSGNVVQVDDASWFFDGFGISAETGDSIQFDGETSSVRISSIDYATNMITLASSANWSDGQGVHLSYTGAAPDTGAFEYSAAVVRPNPPTDLQSD